MKQSTRMLARLVSRRVMLKSIAGGIGALIVTRTGLAPWDALSVRESSAAGGSSLEFNGQRQYVEIPDHPDLRVRSGFTLEAWVHPTSSGPHQHLAGKHNYELSAEADGSGVRFVFEFSTNWGSWTSAAAGPFPLNRWHHLAGTYDGQMVRLFVNGTLVASTATSGLVDITGDPFYLATVGDGNDFYSGRLAEVRLSGSVRYTASFVPPSAPYVLDAATLALWRLDEGGGTLAADASGNGHDGVLLNNPTWSTDSPFG